MPGKTREWEDLGDTQSICLLVREEAEAQGQEGGGLKLPADPRCWCWCWRSAGLLGGTSSACQAIVLAVRLIRAFSIPEGLGQAPRQGWSWQPFTDSLSQNIRAAVPRHPVWEMLL